MTTNTMASPVKAEAKPVEELDQRQVVKETPSPDTTPTKDEAPNNNSNKDGDAIL